MFTQNPSLLWVALVTLLFILMYIFVVQRVGMMRGRHKIPAPQMTGHPDLEIALRVQANTLEQMVPFMVLLWLAALTWNALMAAILGLIFLLARISYAIGYYRDPAKRMPGFILGMLTMAVLWFGTLFGILRSLWG